MPTTSERAITLAAEIAALYPDQDPEATQTDPAVPADVGELLTIAQAIEADDIGADIAAAAAAVIAAVEPAQDPVLGDLTPAWVGWLTELRMPPATEVEIATLYSGREDAYAAALAEYQA